MIKYNDNELLYLILENDELALQILYEKYIPLIKSRLINFRVNYRFFDDYYQECLITFYKCVKTYREDKSFTFNQFFDKSIQNKIMSLMKNDNKYFSSFILMDDSDVDYANCLYNNVLREDERAYSESDETLSCFEKKIEKYLGDGKTIQEISEVENKDIRSVYNAIARIKKKRKPDGVFDELGIFTVLEKNVYDYQCAGYRAQEIGYFLGVDVTTVYNAFKRIKRKMK